MTVTPDRVEAARAGSERFLNASDGRPSMRTQLAEIAEATRAGERADLYGAGERIAHLEGRIAELLGKEAAVFMPSGVMAQQIALRIWSQRRGVRAVAYHPTSHLELHEQGALQLLHGLYGRRVGDANRLITRADLEGVGEPLAALLLELPQREIGGQLPTWDELVAQAAWARDRGVALHLDGARLWESGPFYGRPYAEIAELFDSVYVSFYKGLGGIAGAALAGDGALVEESRVWQRRHGGNLVTLHPLVVSAELALDDRLGRMPAYLDHARTLAAAIATVDGVEVLPDPPQVPMFHVLLRGQRERLLEEALRISEERKIFLFGRLATTTLPDWHRHEIAVGEPSLELRVDEVRDLYAELLARSRNP